MPAGISWSKRLEIMYIPALTWFALVIPGFFSTNCFSSPSSSTSTEPISPRPSAGNDHESQVSVRFLVGGHTAG